MNANSGGMPIGAMLSQAEGGMPSVDMNAPVAASARVEGEMPAGAMTGGLAAGMPLGSMLASAIAAASEIDAMPRGPCGCG